MKKIVRKDNSRRKKILSIGLVLFLFMGIGYSVISSNLLFNGSIELSKYESPYLYDVLKFEALRGGLARKYTGEHHDSFTEEPSKDIYHWYATTDAEGTQVLDKNNVIFADHCWQMIRTTDTGGVKMIYNGEAENGQCLNTRGNHVGYYYSDSISLNGNYWYGTDYTYDFINKVFNLSGTTEQATCNETTGPDLIGKYTCRLTSENGTCSTLYLVESYNRGSSAYAMLINSDSHYSQFGTLRFNSDNSLSYVGYMYNALYPFNIKSLTLNGVVLSSFSLSTTYWYADSISYTNSNYSLDNPFQISTEADYQSLVGKYTFCSSSQTYKNSSVYYIVAVEGSTMYYIQLNNSGNHTLADFNYTYTYGDSYTDNGDGTYTINNSTAIERKNWYTGYSILGNKYVCKNAVNDTCSDLWYATSTSKTGITYFSAENNYKYAKSFTWDGSKYVLDNDTSISFWNINDSTNITSFENAHYTCWNTTGECTDVSYIFGLYNIQPWIGNRPYYINITDGKSIDDAKNEMLFNNDVNQINSTIKSGVDAWYKHTMLDYDDYIEDTIYCNDRSISNHGGWNANGGRISKGIEFNEYNMTSNLSCSNTTDKFSVSNNNAKLTYKVGLMSSPEMNILNNNNARKSGVSYWLASPFRSSSDYVNGVDMSYDGSLTSSLLSNREGIRPAISLKPGTEYIVGDGSMANPYVVKPVRECTYNGELTQGAEFVDGQYTYRYMQEWNNNDNNYSWVNINNDGWGVKLTDPNSTDPVETKLCTSINNKPIVSMSNMFANSKSNYIDNISSFDTSNVTNMSGMFEKSRFYDIFLNYFDTSKVTDMSRMFSESYADELNIGNFDTSSVTNMSRMFYSSEADSIDISNFDTSKVTDMSEMFYSTRLLQYDLTNFDTRRVTDMHNMFCDCNLANSIDVSSFNDTSLSVSDGMFCSVEQNIITTGSNFEIKSSMFTCDHLY